LGASEGGTGGGESAYIQTLSTILFANAPWWSSDKLPDGRHQLRRGIRAGSRWPFTQNSGYAPDAFQFGHYLPAPIFLMSAAAFCERAMDGQHTVTLRDSIARGESYETFLRYFDALRPDCFIVEVGSASWDHDRLLLEELKRRRPTMRIAVAGPTAATTSKKEIGKTLVDAFILGEYEVGSVAFVEGQNGVIPFSIMTKEQMNRAPYPMYDEEVWWHYWDACPIGAKAPELQIWASRGCFALCNFCSFPATMTNNDPLGLGGRKIRFYEPQYIEGMIRDRMEIAARSGYPLASVRFDGDTENASNKHTLAICEVMRRIGLPWSMMCRADTSSREVWQAMKDSGCFGVKLGFESGVDRIVNEVVKKNLDLKEAEATAKFLRGIGMSVHGTFMVGSPTETAEEKQQTIDFIKRLYDENGLNSHQLSGCAELDGTPLANQTISDPNYVRDKDGAHKVEGLMR
jgi:radical SAM superfamily enzyme YgiQ (UPF0313 family)